MLIRLLLSAVALTCASAAGCRWLASHLTINVTPSVPIGIYWLRPSDHPTVGATVSLTAPPGLQRLIAERSYLPSDFTLLKRVVAVTGDDVCITQDRYLVNGKLLSTIAVVDRSGRALPPPFPFCGAVPPGLVFLGAQPSSSLDSRFFGPVSETVLTTAVPLWTSS